MQVAAVSGQDFIRGIDDVGIKKGIRIVKNQLGLDGLKTVQKVKALHDLGTLQAYLDQDRYRKPQVFTFPEVGPEIESRLNKFLNEKYKDGNLKRVQLRQRILDPQSKNVISKLPKKQFKKTRKDERAKFVTNQVEKKSFRLANTSGQISDSQASITNPAAAGKKRKAEHSPEVK